MDEGRAALPHIGALHQVGELAFRQPRSGVLQETVETGIAECGADAQPFDLLVRFDEPQAYVVGIHENDRELRFELANLARDQRADETDALRAAAFELLDRL